MMSRSFVAIAKALCIVLALGSMPASAGTFIDFTANQNRVVHGGNYDGTGGEIQVSVCLDPTARPLTGDPTQAIENVLATFNQLTPVIGNVANNPDGGSDFESVLLHEVGHCIGMDHNALGPSETGNNAAFNYYANAFPGPNGVFDVNPGTDNVRGSRDDVRGDDINRNWFRRNTNDPFEIPPAVVDRATYSTSLADLPAGHNFVENSTSFGPCNAGQPDTSALRGFPPTQNTMFPVICTSNVIRQLAPDDVATLRIARAGRDGIQGTADDYTLRLNYIGEAEDCDIRIRFTNTAGFALCETGAVAAPNGDWAITGAVAEFQNTVDWFFNQEPGGGGGNIGPTISANTPANNSTTQLGGGDVGAFVDGAITFNAVGGSGTGTTSLSCEVGSGSIILTSNATQTIAVGGTVNPVGVRFTLTNTTQNGVINCTATPQGGQVANFSYTFTANAGGDVPPPPTEQCAVVGQAIPDNDAQGLSSALTVNDGGTIDKLEVLLDIEHTYVGDLIIDLRHEPSNTNVRLVDRPGVTDQSPFGCAGANIKTTLDDEAQLSIQDNCQDPAAYPEERYRPANSLSAFNGLTITGDWVLTVSDNAEDDTGQLLRWCLVPTTSGVQIEIFADRFQQAP